MNGVGVSGASLKRARQSRGWTVRRLAGEFTKASDETIAPLASLMQMINQWERGDRNPSEMYWLLYLKVLPGLRPPAPRDGTLTSAGQAAAIAEAIARRAASLPGPDEIRTLSEDVLASPSRAMTYQEVIATTEAAVAAAGELADALTQLRRAIEDHRGNDHE